MSMLESGVMERISEHIEMEFVHETSLTRKMLERAPIDQLGWRPHPKSRTLGQLISHLVSTVSWGPDILEHDDYVMDPAYKEPEYTTLPEILAAFDAGVAATKLALEGKSDEEMLKLWRFKIGERVVLEMPRKSSFRVMILSHSIHHRGQLSVYLRLKNVPLPQVYGPTADEPDLF